MRPAHRGASTRSFLLNTMRNTVFVVGVAVLCVVVQLGRCGDVGAGSLGSADPALGGFGAVPLAFGGGPDAGLLGLSAPGSPLAVPLAASVSFVRQPFVRVGYVARPVLTYIQHPVATVSHTVRPFISMSQALVGSNVPLAGVGPGPGGLRGGYAWKR